MMEQANPQFSARIDAGLDHTANLPLVGAA